MLATTVVKAAIERSGVSPDAVGHVVMGNVIPTDTNDAYFRLGRDSDGIRRFLT